MVENIGLWVGYFWGITKDFLLDAETPGHKLALMLVAILLFVAVMGAVLLAVDRPKRVPSWAVTAAFAGPALLALAFGLVYPALRTTYGSFFNRNGTEFVGLDNYVTAFTQESFQVVLRNTALWVLLVPTLATFIGLVYAVVVDRTRFEKVAKALIFLPMAISLVGASIIWRFVYEYRDASRAQTGLANQLLVWLGLDPYQFLVDQPLNNVFLIAVLIWIQAGFAMTILSAAIKAIPDDIVEAATLDGLKGLEMFRYITVPSIRPALVVVVTTIAMTTLKVFDIVRTMTGGNFGTSVVANEFYAQSFVQGNAGMGAALAVILFLIVIPVVVYNVRQLRLSEEIR
ncbi:carbohydrate ABC transporter permease [Cellulomonas marina]|uniref:Alpha-glucoside transport system permease protein n=1 Tax=Cellulomonas marina TaxID=988821 RepID=A0A1I1AC17_9CELL|nr:sugar ABC transporter permease [Cellulomonas marina]GIG30388.1 ABC transporter [Cellulomonas marina]SFB34916.1 alpha-glucoside transport system permease protein [Cellulomonas marina]